MLQPNNLQKEHAARCVIQFCTSVQKNQKLLNSGLKNK